MPIYISVMVMPPWCLSVCLSAVCLSVCQVDKQTNITVYLSSLSVYFLVVNVSYSSGLNQRPQDFYFIF